MGNIQQSKKFNFVSKLWINLEIIYRVVPMIGKVKGRIGFR